MSNLFSESADFYDMLYRDKNYEAECDFIEKIFNQFGEFKTENILDLGCGTGGHLLPLTRRGYKLTGADLSKAMLDNAYDKIIKAGLEVNLVQGDLRRLNLNKEFDSVIAMFNVIGYQTSNSDLTGAFETAARHLKKGGLPAMVGRQLRNGDMMLVNRQVSFAVLCVESLAVL